MMRTIEITYQPGATDELGDPRPKTEEWACNNDGGGVFSRRRDGTWQQHVGTCDAPRFKTPAQLRAYIRRAFGVRGGRVTSTENWPKRRP